MSLKPKEINENIARAILHLSKLPKRGLCTTLEAVYSDGTCPYIYKITENKLGEGRYGKVYQACCQENCEFVAKWQSNRGSAISEARIQSIAGGLAPNVHELWLCKEGGIIIMDRVQGRTVLEALGQLTEEQEESAEVYSPEEQRRKIGGNDVALRTLKDFRKYNPDVRFKVLVPDTPEQMAQKKEILAKVVESLRSLHNLGIVHGDAHLNNFIIGNDGSIKVIDFGQAEFEGDVKRDFKDLENSLIKLKESQKQLRYLSF